MSLQFQSLLEPGTIGNLPIPNRLVKAPLSTGLCHRDGSVSERLVRHYSLFAKGGTGLIIVEGAHIDKLSSKSVHCHLDISDDETIAGLSWLADTIKESGCRAAIQINHCGRQKLLSTSPVKSASAVTWQALYQRHGPAAVPEPLTVSEIQEIIEAFGNAAERARIAGFDLVEINGAHGDLITNFLSPHTNKRFDVYGGSQENRMRFLLETVKSVRSHVGTDFPVAVRLSGTDYEPDGINIEETILVCRALESRGIDALHISGGDYHQLIHLVSPMTIPEGHHVWASAAVKKEVNLPIIASGSILTPEFAEEILGSGKSDFIALGRSLLADPDWIKKLNERRPEDIRPCIRCNDGCLERSFLKYRSIGCSVNPSIGHETESDAKVTLNPKKIAVIGGGLAGMELALVCTARGHQVTIFEKRKLGGRLIEWSVSRYRSEIKKLLQYLQIQIYKCNIKVILQEAMVEEITNGEFDVAVVATGSLPLTSSISGSKRSFVHHAFDIPGNNAKLGKSVVVVGGSALGTETALWLDELGKNVILLESTGRIMHDCVVTDRIALGEKLAMSRIDVRTNCKIEKITESGVLIDDGGNDVEVQTDALILADGNTPDTRFADLLKQETDLEVHCIGDCVNPGKVFDAVHSAHLIANLI